MAWQAPLFSTTSQSLLKLMSIESVMDTEAWRPAGHGVPKSQTRLSNWTELNLQSFLQVFWLLSFYPGAKLSDDSVLNS